jgi:Glycosyltransferase family 87
MALAATRRDLAVLTALALAVLAAATAFTWSRADDASSWDVPLYESFGDRIVDGGMPYRDVAIEYPPGALPAFVLPSLATRAFGDDNRPSVYEPAMNDAARSYAFWFATLMAVALGATIVALAASLATLGASRRRAAAALGVVATVPVLLGELALTRFDALPVALTAVATTLLLRDRRTWAAIVLGAAIATKLYPLLLLPLAFAFVLRRHGRAAATRFTAWVVGTFAGVFLPFFVAAPSETWFSVRAQLSRGLQVESLAGSVVLAADGALEKLGLATGLASVDEGGTGSVRSADVVGATGTVLGLLCGLLSLAVVVWVWRAAFRDELSGAELVRGCAAVVAAQLALGRVLSPQFVLWLVPFVPLVPGRRGRAALGLLVASLAATHVWFPELYRDYVNDRTPVATTFLLGRNLLLVALLAVLVAPSAYALRQRSPKHPSAGGTAKRASP